MASKVDWLFAHIPEELSDDVTAINDASSKVEPIDFSDPLWAGVVNITAEDGTPNDTMRFVELKVEHNGLFACQVKNTLGNDTTLLMVAVKDRWAALWPFIGIVIEVTLLVAAILLYERHQMRAKPANNNNNADNNVNVDVTSPNDLTNDNYDTSVDQTSDLKVEKNAKSEEVRLRTATKT